MKSGVRSGAEVRARFEQRHASIVKAMEAARRNRGTPSWDAARGRAQADGVITIREDGSEMHRISPESAALLGLRQEMFEFKFGRPMQPGDLYFFDVDADTPQPKRMDPEAMIA